MNSLIPCAVLLPDASRSAARKHVSQWVLLADRTDYLGVGRLQKSPAGKTWQMQDGRTLQLDEVTYWATLLSVPSLSGRIENAALLDKDGYPSGYALGLLQTWPWGDPPGWFGLVRKLWHFEELGFHQEEKDGSDIWHLSTFGWSGNESIIRAMELNEMLWHACWSESKRGGHYRFVVEKEER